MASGRVRRGARAAQILAGVLASGAGCVGPSNYGAGGHYQGPEAATPSAPAPALLSAHVSAFGVEPPLGEQTQTRMLDVGEPAEDRIVLVFGQELDPLTVDPRGFGVIRADGRRVRPKRALLAPADEGDENRSLTLLGNFGSEDAPPVAVHVIGGLHAETGEELAGLDAPISGLREPDRALVVERLEPSSSRCPEARQVIRSYWTDALDSVGVGDLGAVELHLADGRVLAPVDFDDQAQREEDQEGDAGLAPGRADDNVLDLCVDADEAVVHVRFGAGIFTDAGGRPTAAADLTLSATLPSASASTGAGAATAK